LNNLFWAADKRFAGVGASSNLQSQFFNGNFDSGYTIPANTTYVVTIDTSGYITYPSGYVYITFYHTSNKFSNITGRKYSAVHGTWSDFGGFEDIAGGSGSNIRQVRMSTGGGNYGKIYEITFTTGADSINVVDISFAGGRCSGGDFSGAFRKDRSQILVHNTYFRNNSFSNVGSIVVGGSSTAYNTTSDYRVKHNVAPFTNAIEKVQQLSPITFSFIADTTDTMIDGFLAHEVADIVPEAVTGVKDAVVPPELFTSTDPLPDGVSIGDVKEQNGQDELQQLDQSKLVPLLTAALKEAIIRIEALENATGE
jgi:hypothetical protein